MKQTTIPSIIGEVTFRLDAGGYRSVNAPESAERDGLTGFEIGCVLNNARTVFPPLPGQTANETQ